MLDVRLTKEVRDQYQRGFFLALLQFLQSICIVGGAYFTAWIVDGVFLKSRSVEEAVPQFMVLLLFLCLRPLCIWGIDVLAKKIAVRVKSRLRKELSQRIFMAGTVTLNGEENGALLHLLTESVESVDEYFSKFLPQLITVAIVPIVIIGVVLPLDLSTLFLFCITAPLIPIFMILIGKRAEKANQRQWKTLSHLSQHFFEVMKGLTVLKLFGRSKDQEVLVRRSSENFRTATMSVLRVAFLSALVLEMVATLSVALVAVTVGLRLLSGEIDFLLAFFLLLIAPEFYQPFRQLGSAFHSAITAVTAAQHIYQRLGEGFAMRGEFGQGFCTQNVAIEFQQVNFAYENKSTFALDDVSLDIPANQRIAIVGTSGAGKTTLIRAILGFITPQTGEVLINGRNLQNLTKRSWFSHIAYVGQNPHIFQATIAENIALAKHASLEEIKQAAKLAKAHDFIMQLAEGYETKIGDGGQSLSGGQKRRLALARVFLQDVPLVILDEPTAGIDVKTEMELEESLDALGTNRTLIFIAHKLKLAQKADKIVVMEQGRICEMGSHEELIARNGTYAALYQAYKGALS